MLKISTLELAFAAALPALRIGPPKSLGLSADGNGILDCVHSERCDETQGAKHCKLTKEKELKFM